MSVKVEQLEHNMAKLTVEVPAEDFVKAIENAYKRQKGKISLPGFRKGKAPLQMIEQMYGKSFFYDDAANECINNSYYQAVEESGLEVVSEPTIGVDQIGRGQAFIYTAEVAVKPEVTLGEYRGLEVPKNEVVVTDEDVEDALKAEQEKNSRMIDIDDRGVENGDTIHFDYAGSIDGVPFEGGSANDADLEIGSGRFIPGFEEQLVGMQIGESRDITVTFPEDYHAKELAGKEAVFACAVHRIQKKDLPALDDDFAQDVSEFDTLEEYKADLRKNLTERRENAARIDKENAAVDKLIEASQMDIPEAMITTQMNQMYSEMAQRYESQGLSMDTLLKYMNTTREAYMENLRPQALKRIQTRLVLEAVAANEKFDIDDSRVEEEVRQMAEQYKVDADKIVESMTDFEKDQMKKDMAVQEAVKFLADNAVEVEVKEEEDAE